MASAPVHNHPGTGNRGPEAQSQPAPQNDLDGDWYTDERSIREILISELQRFKRRMKARPLPVLLAAVLATTAVLFWSSRKVPAHTARVVLRISESALSRFGGPVLPQRGLKDYIYSFSLSDPVLLEQVINKHNLYQSELKKFGPDAAIAELRDGLNISVFHNYFFFSKRYESTPRSLRLAISYTHADAAFAYKMAKICADIVIEREANRRIDELRLGAQDTRQLLQRTTASLAAQQQRVSAVNQQLAAAEIEGDRSRVAALGVELSTLNARLRATESKLDTLQTDLDKFEFERQLEAQNLGLLFEFAGEVQPQPQPLPGPVVLGLIGLFCLGIFVPLCAIVIGTLDARILESGDVRRLGMPVLGHIPKFPGDHVGSLRERGARAPQTLRSRLRQRSQRRARRTGTH